MIKTYLIQYTINDKNTFNREQQATNPRQAVLLLTSSIEISYMFQGIGKPKIIVKKVEEV